MNTGGRKETTLGAGSCPGRHVWTAKHRAAQGPCEELLAQFIRISILCCGLFPSPTRPCVQPPGQALPPSSPHSFALYPPNLLLKILSLEGEQEPTHVVLTQLVDASGIDGSAQELIYLIFRVQSILGTPADNGMQVLPGAWVAPQDRQRQGQGSGSSKGRLCELSVAPAPTSSEKWEVSAPTAHPRLQMPPPPLPDPSHRPTYLSLLESSMPWRKKRNAWSWGGEELSASTPRIFPISVLS